MYDRKVYVLIVHLLVYNITTMQKYTNEKYNYNNQINYRLTDNNNNSMCV